MLILHSNVKLNTGR